MENGYNAWMTTVDEFKAMLEELYANDFILIDIHELAKEVVDENGNVKIGHVIDEGSKNSFVYSSSKLVATIGLEDVVVVETEDAILACKSDRV